MVWMKPCLTRDLLREFSDLWRRYTAPSVDRQSTKVRELTRDECAVAIDELVSLANKVTVAAARSEQWSACDVAYAAHQLEVGVAGTESGIQDHLSAAFGGISYLEVEPYPEATVRTLPAWAELGPLLTLIFLGRAHDSSEVHRQVIEAGSRVVGLRALARRRARSPRGRARSGSPRVRSGHDRQHRRGSVAAR